MSITEFDRWVGANNIPAEFEYSKGWWDYVELVRRLAIKFDMGDVRVIGHYEVSTPPPCEHPRRFDRIFNALDRYDLDPNAPAWIFATVSLKLHMDHSDYEAPTVEYESYRECMSAYIDIIAEAERQVEEDEAIRARKR